MPSGRCASAGTGPRISIKRHRLMAKAESRRPEADHALRLFGRSDFGLLSDFDLRISVFSMLRLRGAVETLRVGSGAVDVLNRAGGICHSRAEAGPGSKVR